ncbi:MAG: N-acetylmuramoyl-L-alanine amidase [Candidatus Nanopelagicales bacterium]
MRIARSLAALIGGGLLVWAAATHAGAIPVTTAPQRPTVSASEAVAPGAIWKPIPYGAKRQAQMARYSLIHYGMATAELTDVRQIVLHFTAGSTAMSAWHTFAANTAAHQPTGGYSYPGTCTHFIVGKDAKVYQLVPLNLMCRHVVGLNDQSIGIEFVEESSASRVLARDAQSAAGVKLVRWLQERYGIADSDVIGHAQVNRSRFFTELQPGWRNTHTDWNAAQVARFRARL